MATKTVALSAEEKLIKKTYVCIGQRITKDGTPCAFYLPVEKDEAGEWHVPTADEDQAIGMKLRGADIPGGIVRVHETENKAYVTRGPNAPVWLGSYPKNDHLTAWQVQDRTARLRVQAAKVKKKDLKDLDEMHALWPVRALYLNARTKTERAAILTVVIEYVTGG